jgi:hypothetical protein
MTYDSVNFSTIEEAREYAASKGGKYLVLTPEILQRIEDAEAAGGFEGGMTGQSSGAPYSATGTPGVSESTETMDVTGVSLDGWRVPTLEGTIETFMDLKDVVGTWFGEMTGPILLVPKSELDRWVGRQNPGDGA